MNDIIAFLNARLDDDERIALRAGGAWREDGDGTGVILCSDGRHAEALIEAHIGSLAPHITRHDPARVLASVAAIRKIIALHSPNESSKYAPSHCDCQQEDGVVFAEWPCETAKLLASVDASHPDYRTEWAL